MSRKLKLESDEDRMERLKTLAQEHRSAKTRESDALDAMVRKSIKLHGV